jgi:hypothetical protein
MPEIVMGKSRKKKLQERKDRLERFRKSGVSARWVPGEGFRVQDEVDHIVRCAAERDARCVTLGLLLFFSTDTGDAWMLDASDDLALCLAREGARQPVRILESDTKFVIEWDRTYSIEGENFTTFDKQGRVSTVSGYPTSAILTAIERAKQFLKEPL